jgi:hypothetical protein
MANTFIKIQTATVGAGGAATIDFTSIPQNYTDLQIFFSLRSNRGFNDDDVNFKLNTLTTNQTKKWLSANGSGTGGSGNDTSLSLAIWGGSSTAGIFGNGYIYIPNYSGANYKSISGDSVQENNTTGSGSSYQNYMAGLWSATAAITAISLYSSSSSTLQQYSTATLYGIKSS